MEDTRYYIYLLTNKPHRIFFTDVTTDIKIRLKQHEREEFNTSAKKYSYSKLIYFEITLDRDYAQERKRIIDSLSRAQKIKLITQTNPRWRNFGAVWHGNTQFNSTSVLNVPPLSTQPDMAPPNRLPDDEMLSFDFGDT